MIRTKWREDLGALKKILSSSPSSRNMVISIGVPSPTKLVSLSTHACLYTYLCVFYVCIYHQKHTLPEIQFFLRHFDSVPSLCIWIISFWHQLLEFLYFALSIYVHICMVITCVWKLNNLFSFVFHVRQLFSVLRFLFLSVNIGNG